MFTTRRELELLALAAFAAVPFYGSETIQVPLTAAFHLAVAFLVVLVARGRQPVVGPGAANLMAAAYLLFFPIDVVLLSQRLIVGSIHLVFFIVVLQAIVPSIATRYTHRLVVIFMIFTASVANATSVLVIPFAATFLVLAVRQLIVLCDVTTRHDAGVEGATEVRAASALAFVAPALLIASLLFPLLPRVHNPLIRGMSSALDGSSVGVGPRIDLRDDRSISSDGSIVARVWMPYDAIPFFAPLRLRARVYDRWDDGVWISENVAKHAAPERIGDVYQLAHPVGFSREALIQQRLESEGLLYLPVGTHSLSGIGRLSEGPAPSMWRVVRPRGGEVTFRVRMSRQTLPLVYHAPPVSGFPPDSRIEVMAREIAGTESDPQRIASRIESHLANTFDYVPDPADLGQPVEVDQFLLEVRRGHCEYFAAGMVVLLESLNVPARIVGGYYGGILNPLTGYFTIRKDDAHAWVEVWDGERWLTYDPTPAALRPGIQSGGLRLYLSSITDSINYFWDRYVLTFGLGDQMTLLAESITRGTRALAAMRAQVIQTVTSSWFRRQLVVAVLLFCLIALLLIGWARRQRPLFGQLIDRLEGIGIRVGLSTTELELVARVRKLRPDLIDPVESIVRVHLQERYGDRHVSASAVKDARQALARIR